MTTKEIADRLVELCRTGDFEKVQKELFAEGKRWFDLVRTDHVLQIMDPVLKQRQTLAGADTTGFGGDKRKYLWPLHRNVLNANNKLIQNPPYGG